MVNISKSGEEGYYPDLQKAAEERLRSLSPNNHHLRNEEPVLTRNSMNNDEWNETINDFSSWKKEISVRELRLTEENNNTIEDISHPPVRQLSAKCALDKKPAEKKAKVKHARNPGEWDQFDADAELLKMDLEEEREKEERQRERRQAETDRLELIIKDAEKLSPTEREILADQEKNRGNEYYQAKEYNEAIKYYTASIAIWPTAKAYNNRAACYLKQCKYSAALADANSTLELEPDNVKALFRRGIAFQHKNMYREALADMNAVLRQQPKHLLAQHILKELREQILTQPKTYRIMTDEGSNKPKKVVEISEKKLTTEIWNGNSYEVNEWGLPKVMCHCNGSPRFLQLNTRKCTPPHYQPVVNSARIVELSDEPELPRASTKLEIVEVEKSDPIEDFFKPIHCAVDKETNKIPLTNGDITSDLTRTEDFSETVKIGNHITDSACGESGMDEDGLNYPPLFDDALDVVDPAV